MIQWWLGDWRDVKRSPSVPAMKSHEQNHEKTVPGRCQVQQEEIPGSESFQVHGDWGHRAWAEMARSVHCTPLGFLLSEFLVTLRFGLCLPHKPLALLTSLRLATCHLLRGWATSIHQTAPFLVALPVTCLFCLLLCHPPLCL